MRSAPAGGDSGRVAEAPRFVPFEDDPGTWAERLESTRARVAAALGLAHPERLLFAPGCTYPAHAHEGITESYYVLSGTVSENDDGVYAPGSLIFNPPGRMHRITVSARNPALLAYAWAGKEESIEGQVMRFTRARPSVRRG